MTNPKTVISDNLQPDAWKMFDGEGGYDFTDNQETAEHWKKHLGNNYANWLTSLYEKSDNIFHIFPVGHKKLQTLLDGSKQKIFTFEISKNPSENYYFVDPRININLTPEAWLVDGSVFENFPVASAIGHKENFEPIPLYKNVMK